MFVYDSIIYPFPQSIPQMGESVNVRPASSPAPA